MLVLIMSLINDDDDRDYILKLYYEYKPLVYKKIKEIVGNSDQVEDLVNDTFIKLISKTSLLKTLNPPKTAAYIVLTSRNAAINFIRHRDVQNKHMYYGCDEDIAGTIGELADTTYILKDEEIELLTEAIQRLSEKDRNLLYYKYFLEMKDAEIAERIGCDASSVREYLTRARRRAKASMEKEREHYECR